MWVVNFSHPITAPQLAQIERLCGQSVEQVLDAPAQFDVERSFVEQTHALFATLPLSPSQWQTLPLVVRLPSLDAIAALVLAEIHGRAGYFPTIVRLRPAAGPVRGQFDVAEIIPLQDVRDRARVLRSPQENQA